MQGAAFLAQLPSFLAAAALAIVPAFLLLGLLVLFLERKLIGLAQKRLGISFLGRNGWAHLPADLLKFWVKQTGRHLGAWGSAVGGLSGAILAYLSWSLLCSLFLLSDAGAGLVDFWDFQLLAYFALASLSTLFMYATVLGTKSKYATLAAARLLLATVSLEVFFALGVQLVYAHAGGYALEEVAGATAQAGGLLAALPPLGCFFVLYALFEAKRAPFDHSEAESELVAGHLVELGGRALLLFYLCEYAHLVFCLFLFFTLTLGAEAPGVGCAPWPYFADLLAGALLGV